MRTESSARRAISGLTPCPSWPNTQAQGQGNVLLVQQLAMVRTGGDHRHGQCFQLRRLKPFHQPQAEVRAHAGAQHLGAPQARRARDGERSGEIRRPPRCAGSRPRCRRPAAGRGSPWPGQAASPAPAASSSTKPMRAGDSECAQAGKKRVGDHNVAGRQARPFRRGHGPEGLGKHRDCRASRRVRRLRGKGGRPPARYGPACDRRCRPARAGAGP